MNTPDSSWSFPQQRQTLLVAFMLFRSQYVTSEMAPPTTIAKVAHTPSLLPYVIFSIALSPYYQSGIILPQLKRRLREREMNYITHTFYKGLSSDFTPRNF